jgi:hypothetical protein
MPRTFRFLTILVLLALAALGVSACGSSSDGSSSSAATDATALIKDTFATDHPIRSGRVDADLNVNLQGLPRLNKPLALHLNGPFQSNGGKTMPDFALQLDLDSGSQPITVGAVFARGGGYLTFDGQAFDLGKDIYNSFKRGYLKAKAGARSSGGGAASLSALGIDPMHWLKNPQRQGAEDIAGTQTDHIAAGVDVGRLLDDVSTMLGKARSVTQAGGAAAGTSVPTRLTSQQRDAIARSIKSASLDLWTGQQDHTLRKVALHVDVAVPQDLQARAGGLRSGTIDFQLTLAQLNQPQTVRPPAGARPLGQLKSALQQLGLIGTSSSSGSSSGAGAAPASGPQAGYAKCLNAAGDDLAKVQRCADLLK